MRLNSEQLLIQNLLKDTVVLLCKQVVSFSSDLSVHAVIGITTDQTDGFYINIQENVSLQNENQQTTSNQEDEQLSEARRMFIGDSREIASRHADEHSITMRARHTPFMKRPGSTDRCPLTEGGNKKRRVDPVSYTNTTSDGLNTAIDMSIVKTERHSPEVLLPSSELTSRYTCPRCNVTFNTEIQEYKTHLLLHNSCKPFRCHVCQNLVQHNYCTQLVCDKCNTEYECKTVAAWQMLQQSTCYRCGKKYTYNKALHHHINSGLCGGKTDILQSNVIKVKPGGRQVDRTAIGVRQLDEQTAVGGTLLEERIAMSYTQLKGGIVLPGKQKMPERISATVVKQTDMAVSEGQSPSERTATTVTGLSSNKPSQLTYIPLNLEQTKYLSPQTDKYKVQQSTQNVINVQAITSASAVTSTFTTPPLKTLTHTPVTMDTRTQSAMTSSVVTMGHTPVTTDTRTQSEMTSSVVAMFQSSVKPNALLMNLLHTPQIIENVQKVSVMEMYPVQTCSSSDTGSESSDILQRKLYGTDRDTLFATNIKSFDRPIDKDACTESSGVLQIKSITAARDTCVSDPSVSAKGSVNQVHSSNTSTKTSNLSHNIMQPLASEHLYKSDKKTADDDCVVRPNKSPSPCGNQSTRSLTKSWGTRSPDTSPDPVNPNTNLVSKVVLSSDPDTSPGPVNPSTNLVSKLVLSSDPDTSPNPVNPSTNLVSKLVLSSDPDKSPDPVNPSTNLVSKLVLSRDLISSRHSVKAGKEPVPVTMAKISGLTDPPTLSPVSSQCINQSPQGPPSPTKSCVENITAVHTTDGPQTTTKSRVENITPIHTTGGAQTLTKSCMENITPMPNTDSVDSNNPTSTLPLTENQLSQVSVVTPTIVESSTPVKTPSMSPSLSSPSPSSPQNVGETSFAAEIEESNKEGSVETESDITIAGPP